MPIDLSGLSQAYKITSLANLLLVTPEVTGIQAQKKGLKDKIAIEETIIFHYEGEQTVTLESDITDHYTEDNTSIQDQIALRPETITTNGFVGNLTNALPPEASALKEAKSKLVSLGPYLPELTVEALRVYNVAEQAYRIASNIQNIVEQASLSPSKRQTTTQKYYAQFYKFWKERYLFTVQTPWAVFNNCAILRLRAIEDQDTKEITNFEITFKQIRIAGSLSNEEVKEGRAESQSQEGTSTESGVQSIADSNVSPSTAYTGVV